MRKAYMNVGRSLYSALNWKNWLSESVWFVVPMIRALPSVPRAANARMTRSAIEMLRFALWSGASASGGWPSSTDSGFILFSITSFFCSFDTLNLIDAFDLRWWMFREKGGTFIHGLRGHLANLGFHQTWTDWEHPKWELGLQSGEWLSSIGHNIPKDTLEGGIWAYLPMKPALLWSEYWALTVHGISSNSSKACCIRSPNLSNVIPWKWGSKSPKQRTPSEKYWKLRARFTFLRSTPTRYVSMVLFQKSKSYLFSRTES